MQRQPPRIIQQQDSSRLPKPWLIGLGAIALFSTTFWTVSYLLNILSPPTTPSLSGSSAKPQISLQPYLVQPASPAKDKGEPAAKPKPVAPEAPQISDTNAVEPESQPRDSSQSEEGSAAYSRREDYSAPRPAPPQASQTAPSPPRKWKPKPQPQPTAPPIIPVAPPTPPPQASSVSVQVGPLDRQSNIRWPNRKRDESYGNPNY